MCKYINPSFKFIIFQDNSGNNYKCNNNDNLYYGKNILNINSHKLNIKLKLNFDIIDSNNDNIYILNNNKLFMYNFNSKLYKLYDNLNNYFNKLDCQVFISYLYTNKLTVGLPKL